MNPESIQSKIIQIHLGSSTVIYSKDHIIIESHFVGLYPGATCKARGAIFISSRKRSTCEIYSILHKTKPNRGGYPMLRSFYRQFHLPCFGCLLQFSLIVTLTPLGILVSRNSALYSTPPPMPTTYTTSLSACASMPSLLSGLPLSTASP